MSKVRTYEVTAPPGSPCAGQLIAVEAIVGESSIMLFSYHVVLKQGYHEHEEKQRNHRVDVDGNLPQGDGSYATAFSGWGDDAYRALVTHVRAAAGLTEGRP